MNPIDIRKVLVLGAGKVGRTVADMLAEVPPASRHARGPRAHATEPRDRLVRHTCSTPSDDAALAAALDRPRGRDQRAAFLLRRTRRRGARWRGACTAST